MGRLAEAELKSHQQRRIALDRVTAEILGEHVARWEGRLTSLGKRLTGREFLLAGAPDGNAWPRPDGITQRYQRRADQWRSRRPSTSCGTTRRRN